MVLQQGAEVVDGQRDALEEVGLALEEATVTVGAEGLQYAHEDVGVVLVGPLAPRIALETAHVEVVAQELAAYGVGQVALGAVEQRGYVVLRGTLSTALIVDVVESE